MRRRIVLRQKHLLIKRILTIMGIFLIAFSFLTPSLALEENEYFHSEEKGYYLTVIVKDESNNAIQNASVVLINSDSVFEVISGGLSIKTEEMRKYRPGVWTPTMSLSKGTTDDNGKATLNASFGTYDLSILEIASDSDYFLWTWTKKGIKISGDTIIYVTLIETVPSKEIEHREVSESEYLQIITQIQYERYNNSIMLNTALGDMGKGLITEKEMLTTLKSLYMRFSDLFTQMESIKPPSKYESFHNYRLRSMEFTLEAISWFTKAIEEDYTEYISKGMDYLSIANEYEDKATDELDRAGVITPTTKIEPRQVSEDKYRNILNQIENEKYDILDSFNTALDDIAEGVIIEEEMLTTLKSLYPRLADLNSQMKSMKPPSKYESFHNYKVISMELYFEAISQFIEGINKHKRDYIDRGYCYKTIASDYEDKALHKLVSTDIMVEMQSTAPTPTPIGFEVAFAIAGLLTVTYFLRRRK